MKRAKSETCFFFFLFFFFKAVCLSVCACECVTCIQSNTYTCIEHVWKERLERLATVVSPGQPCSFHCVLYFSDLKNILVCILSFNDDLMEKMRQLLSPYIFYFCLIKLHIEKLLHHTLQLNHLLQKHIPVLSYKYLKKQLSIELFGEYSLETHCEDCLDLVVGIL